MLDVPYYRDGIHAGVFKFGDLRHDDTYEQQRQFKNHVLQVIGDEQAAAKSGRSAHKGKGKGKGKKGKSTAEPAVLPGKKAWVLSKDSRDEPKAPLRWFE